MIKKILLAVVALLVLAAGGVMLYVNRDYEQPRYTVIKTEDGVELRQYQAQVVAEVYTEGRMDEKMNDAFRLLAGYIFGNNIAMTAPVATESTGQKIAMTAPVTGAQGDGGFVTRFVMPNAYTLDALPKPKDNRVRLRNQPARKIVAARFSGFVTQDKKDEALQKILAFAVNNNIALGPEVQVAYYENPYTTLPWMRRNEVQVEATGATE